MTSLQVLWESLFLLIINMMVATAFAIAYFYQYPETIQVLGRLL